GEYASTGHRGQEQEKPVDPRLWLPSLKGISLTAAHYPSAPFLALLCISKFPPGTRPEAAAMFPAGRALASRLQPLGGKRLGRKHGAGPHVVHGDGPQPHEYLFLGPD